ncbi:Phytanoyl-CoA dioxygenase [Penicillium angulare]|uniref:Phytanoyl-CoA dioxygenase n=1 Tax=Penicillium angulare TaxID=116970 RepID=A0A9W9FVG6_9EURO|nr:Phytanoyl-CoA dioxygenase [Penicillium angulare]
MTTTTTQTMTKPINRSPFKLEGPYGDFRDELQSEGFVVIKDAITPEKAKYYQQKALDWLQDLSPNIDYDNPSTWTKENLPIAGGANNYTAYSVAHEKFMWEARMEPKVLEAFAKIWGTDELLVSFDGLNVTLPNKPARTPWPHVDQSPFRRGLHCIQGIINLSHAGPEDGSLILLPKSNALSDEFFDTQVDPSTWQERDFRFFSEEEMEWYHARGVKPMKVFAEPGDLILWDSRTAHWGGEPTPQSNTIRTVIYASFSPASLASKESLKRKKEAFESFRATAHWPHDNIMLRDNIIHLPDGAVDPRNRTKPVEEPEYTDQLLQLAGIFVQQQTSLFLIIKEIESIGSHSLASFSFSFSPAFPPPLHQNPPASASIQMEFPRKRAQIACKFCRHRKRKCDGERPACGFCANAGAQCEYQEGPNEKSDADKTQEILERLEQLENLVRQQSTMITTVSERLIASGSSPAAPNPSQLSAYVPLASPTCSSVMHEVRPPGNVRIRYDNNGDGPLLIPLGHQTPTGNLLTLDKIQKLVGEYPQDHFLILESERKLQPLAPRLSYRTIIERLNSDRTMIDLLISSFFTHVHSQFPILEHVLFLITFEKFLQPNQEPNISAAICLMVLALGEICADPNANFDMESSQTGNGTEYFAHAYQILNSMDTVPFSRDLNTPLAFLYASIYFRFRCRPLQAWKCIHSASTAAQLALSYDDLAEFHFPRSGIEALVDELPFPEFTDQADPINLKFLAMCSMRKLLNRIHSTIYSNKPIESNITAFQRNTEDPRSSNHHSSIASLESVNLELKRQLAVWFDSLPDTIKPDLQVPNTLDLQDCQLRSRYHAAAHVICRPWLVFAAQFQESISSEYVMTNCEACVDACRHLILASVPLLKRRTYSVWLRLQALLAAVFVLSLARDTPTLASLVPDYNELIEQAILSTEPWARHHETADAILGIFKLIRQKLRLKPIDT